MSELEIDDRRCDVRCCLCGNPIQPNPVNTCVSCLQDRYDITEGIERRCDVTWCRFCGRYQVPPTGWVYAELESSELMSILLKRIKGLNKVSFDDASFIWTEPHSRRIEIKLTVSKEVLDLAVLRQEMVVQFVVNTCQCPECARLETEHTWTCCVQVRQKTISGIMRTLAATEQRLLRRPGILRMVNSIESVENGVDFYFASKSMGQHFVDWVKSVAPATHKLAKKLISQDFKSNVCSYKYTFAVDMIPICRYDLILIPKKLHRRLPKEMGRIALVYKVSSVLHIIDPVTNITAEISVREFNSNKFRPLISYTKEIMTEFDIMDVQFIETRGRFGLADAEVIRSADLGVVDERYAIHTHLGHILDCGDCAMGYDLTISTVEVPDDVIVPDVILVSKHYPDRVRVHKETPMPDHPLHQIAQPFSDVEDLGSDIEDVNADEAMILEGLIEELPPVELPAQSEEC